MTEKNYQVQILGLQADSVGVNLPVSWEGLAQLIQDNPSLRFTRGMAQAKPSPPARKEFTFTLDRRVLYC